MSFDAVSDQPNVNKLLNDLSVALKNASIHKTEINYNHQHVKCTFLLENPHTSYDRFVKEVTFFVSIYPSLGLGKHFIEVHSMTSCTSTYEVSRIKQIVMNAIKPLCICTVGYYHPMNDN